ncbi:MAG: malto-oligosyltrehalose synthase [Actinomycetota bacterium]|nr:malto-oligosyltrehalose synthase [Actinomycetota bacterium]
MEDQAPPRSTYRVQLGAEFGFDDVAATAGYLADLGVSHLYASPCLQAVSGSSHGYGVVDHRRVSAELGGEEGHLRMCTALREAGIGYVQDLVPNHMAADARENAWWRDLLEHGPSSRYAGYFDVDWDPPEAKLRHTVLLPVLDDHYGRVLEAGALKLQREGGAFALRHGEASFPVSPRSLDQLLGAAAEAAGSAELESLAVALGRLPESSSTDRASVHERHRDAQVLLARLARLCEDDPAVAEAVDAECQARNADPDALDALVRRQNYRLAFWRTAGRELNYRRFFDHNALVGLRAEDGAVFEATHGLVLGWVRAGIVDGLRIDHPDGLRDPEAYLRRVQEATGGTWVVVEKVLQPGERLPPTWPVSGTTGYDFLNSVGGLFVDPAGEAGMTAAHGAATGSSERFSDAVYQAKHLALGELLAADVERLVALVVKACERHRRHRDHSRHHLRQALVELAACLLVYRTYVRSEDAAVSADDVEHVEQALAAARARRPDLDAELIGFLGDLLLLRTRGGDPPGLPAPVDGVEGDLVARFQQLTAAVMAKGAEDTAFYRWLRLVSLNEVGGNPERFATSPEEFHRSCQAAQREHPDGLVALTTHDTKRSEDVRARIGLLSEIPQRWGAAVERWSRHNDRHRSSSGAPDPNTEYLLYQTLVGAWPIDVDRAVAYMEKASREAKVHTSWVDPRPDFDEALRSFVRAVLADPGFVADLAGFVEPLVEPGRITSLAQTLVKLTAPGVPDTYQGTELWDLSLVDPDNRRPVDYGLRRRLLAELGGMKAEDVWARCDEGLPKLAVTQRALQLRRRRPELFDRRGAYRPLEAGGARGGHVVGFLRGGAAATVVPRLVIGLGGDWGATTVTLPSGRWRNVLTDDHVEAGSVALSHLLGRFPVALLEAVQP